MKEAMTIIRDALEQDSLDQMREQVSYSMIRAFKCKGIAFCLSDKSMRTMDFGKNYYCKLDSELLDQYVKYFQFIDPFNQNISYLPPVTVIEDLVSRKKFISSELYTDLYKKFGIEHQMSIILRSGKSILAGIALLRDSDSPNFDASDKKRALMLQPYLSEITKKYMHIEIIENRSDMLDSIIDSLPHNKGKIIFDELYNPIHIDNEAQNHLKKLNDQFKDASSDISPQYLIEKTKIYLHEHFGSNTLPNTDHSPLLIKITLNKTNSSIDIYLKSIQTQKGSKYLLLCFEWFSLNSIIEATLNSLNLTDRQKGVVHSVLQGLSNDQIADKLFI